MGIRIREAVPTDASAVARAHIRSTRTTYDGIMPVKYLADLSLQDRTTAWVHILTADLPTSMNFVAETDGGEIVGFIGGGPEREGNNTYLGELYAIYLVEEHQRKGVGRRLVSALTRRMVSDGFHSMLVWVLEDNHPARRFYESLGGEQVGRKTVTIGGTELFEVSYGWTDIADLADET